MYSNIYIDELIEMRRIARLSRDFKKSDSLREYLDTKSVFVFDTTEGQEVFHMIPPMTRDQLVSELEKDRQAEKQFDAWLFSIRSSNPK
jgi:hypothetical protein